VQDLQTRTHVTKEFGLGLLHNAIGERREALITPQQILLKTAGQSCYTVGHKVVGLDQLQGHLFTPPPPKKKTAVWLFGYRKYHTKAG